MSIQHRSALAKFRCGVAPLRLETGRYENIPEDRRLCPICKSGIENEIHVLFHCVAYQDLREQLTNKACEMSNTFLNLSDENKLIFGPPAGKRALTTLQTVKTLIRHRVENAVSDHDLHCLQS
jgi:hypothetical protein